MTRKYREVIVRVTIPAEYDPTETIAEMAEAWREMTQDTYYEEMRPHDPWYEGITVAILNASAATYPVTDDDGDDDGDRGVDIHVQRDNTYWAGVGLHGLG